MSTAESMGSKVCLITGGARGMGRVAATELARMGWRVVIADWEGEAGTRARDAINRGAGEDCCEFVYCNVASLAEVRELADHVLRRYERLDVLINNAGVVDPVRRESPDGHEMHFATCHLGHFLLTRLLLHRLEASAPARIVLISSDGHKACKGLDFEDLNNHSLWRGRKRSDRAAFEAYARAKLCNLYFMRTLKGRMDASRVTVNAVSPGYFVNTTIYRNLRGPGRWIASLVFGFGSLLGLNTPQKAARTHVFLATSDEVDGVSGKYFEHCREKAMSPLADDDEIADRLWSISEDLCGLDQSAS